MAFNFSKIYDKINWRNKPDKTTPIDATNLGKIDTALNVIDDRVIELGKKANDVDEAISTLNSNLSNKLLITKRIVDVAAGETKDIKLDFSSEKSYMIIQTFPTSSISLNVWLGTGYGATDVRNKIVKLINSSEKPNITASDSYYGVVISNTTNQDTSYIILGLTN